MIGVKVNTAGVPAFLRELDLAMAEFERQINRSFAGWTARIFTDLVTVSPQWSGDMVANWKYTVDQPSTAYAPIPSKDSKDWHKITPRQRGDQAAIGMALAQLSQVTPTWRQVVYFANNTPIAPEVAAQSIPIRSVNLVDGRVAMIDFVVTKAEAGAYVA